GGRPDARQRRRRGSGAGERRAERPRKLAERGSEHPVVLEPRVGRRYASRMARGTTRAPSPNAYRGALGRTQTATVHVASARGDLVSAQVYTTVDAVSDPELVDRLHSEDPARALNTVRLDGGEVVRVAVPVLYHDPAAELLVLVLADSQRHRELDE